MAQGTVSAATGSAVSRKTASLSQRLEAAMVAAVEQCAKDGITDPAKVRAAQLKAYEAAKAGFSAAGTSGS